MARAADTAPLAPRTPAAGTKAEASRKAAPLQRPAEAGEGGAGQSKSAAAAQSRLTIDSPGLPKTAAAIREQQQVALKAAQDAALAAEAAASAAQARAASMEKTLEALQRDAKANREAVARLTDALANAQGGSNDTTVWMALAAALGLVSGGLAFALRRERRSASSAWAGDPSSGVAKDLDPNQAGPEAAPQAPSATAIADAAAAAPLPLSGGAGDADAAMLPPAEAPQPVAAGVPAPPAEPEVFGPVSSAPMRNISIEELLDLEQQVEFFTVLGQDEPAVELLTEHVRKTGGTHPFPYLKLLEIYRRLGDRDAYERTRTRFNQRFNAVAPAFDAPADEVVRPLEDYPRAIDRIQRSWSKPVDAMATLENMLVRAEGREGFGVAALEEVLFLFTLARDVHLQQAGPTSEAGSDVDVLLPFADSKPMGFVDSTVPDDGAAKEPTSGSLAVNFEDEGDLSPAVPPMVSQSARFGITVGIPPEEADRAVAEEVVRPVSSAAPRTSLRPEVPDTNAVGVDLPLGASLMGPFEGSTEGSLDSDASSSAVDLQLGDSAMTPLDQGPADLTLKGRSELPMLSSRGSDEESMDLELGGSMMGSLFGELPKPSGSRASAALEPAPEPAPLPSLEIPLDFDAPAPAAPAPPAPLPSFEINLEGLELEPRPPKPAPGDEGAKGP